MALVPQCERPGLFTPRPTPGYLASIWKGPLLQTSLGEIWQKQKQFIG